MIKQVLSSQNKIVKLIRSLKNSKHRKAEGLFIVEGLRSVKEALNNAEVKIIIVEDSFAISCNELILIANKQDCQIISINHDIFKSLSETKSPQGILAAVVMPINKLENIYIKRGLILALDGLQDPGNMGTIIRTAKATNVCAILLTNDCVDVYSGKVVRSSMGALFSLPIYFTDGLANCIDGFNENGFHTIATVMDGENFFNRINDNENTVLIIGNEANGIDKKVIERASVGLTLPMPGGTESLNAAMSTGIMLYDLGIDKLK